MCVGENKFKLFSIKSSSLIIFLALYHLIFLNWQFWISLNNIVKFDSQSIIFYISLFIVAFLAYFVFFSLFVVPYLTKIFIPFFLITSSVANYMMYTYGVYIDKDMMRNVFETTPREAFDLFTWSAVINVLILGVLPAIYVCCSKIKYNFKSRLFLFLIFLVPALIFAFVSYNDFVIYGRNNRQLRKQVNVLNYLNATKRFISDHYESKRPFQKLDHNAQIIKKSDANAPTVLVMLVGEAARVANFSLAGYEKETNPLLKKQDIAFFDKVTSCGTATATSVPCIFSHYTRKEIDVSVARNTENLLDILKAVGLYVAWKENDDGCKGVCERLDDVETMPDTKDKDFCFGSYCHDEVFFKPLDDFFKRGVEKDTVIVLHTMGSHGPSYYLRYPEEFKKFTPTCDSPDINKCPISDVVNTYDNTILYTDYTISSVIDIVKKYPQYGSAVIYVSDHGESLGENNIFLHGLPYSLAPKVQTEIPMVIWLSGAVQQMLGIDYDCLKKVARTENFSHDNIFSSVLGFFDIKTKFYNKEMDIFALCREN